MKFSNLCQSHVSTCFCEVDEWCMSREILKVNTSSVIWNSYVTQPIFTRDCIFHNASRPKSFKKHLQSYSLIIYVSDIGCLAFIFYLQIISVNIKKNSCSHNSVVLQRVSWNGERWVNYCIFIILRIYHGRLDGWRKWRAYDLGDMKEALENQLWRRWSNGRVGEWAVT